MKVDLHCHSDLSDGKQSLPWLIERAIENGVTHLAITDHDFAQKLEQPENLKLIEGVEISAAWQSTEIHVLGLFVNANQPELESLLVAQRASRQDRAELISTRLSEQGHDGLMEYLRALSAKAYTRSHMADFLVQKKISKTRQKAFKTYLRKGGRAYVPPTWCSLKTCINAIQAGGGIAVLAHPGRYAINKKGLASLVEDFSKLGGDAIEVSYPNIDDSMKRKLEDLAEVADLFMSLGSDFHDAGAHWTDVGKVPPLSREVAERAVWNHERWRG